MLMNITYKDMQGNSMGKGWGGTFLVTPKCLMYRLKYKGFRHYIHPSNKATGNLDGQWNIVKNNEQHKFVYGEG
jgi:hypothetical protein